MPTPAPTPTPHARRLTGALSVLTALSALVMLVGALAAEPPEWFIVIFEVCVLIGCAFGVLFWRGRFPAAPQMTVLCVAGTILAGTAFGPVSVRWSLHGISLIPLVIGRGLIVLTLIAAAGIVALGDDRDAWRRTLRGAVLFALFVAGSLGGWWVLVKSGFSSAVHGVITVAFTIVLYLVLTGLLAGAVHLIITAFADALESRRERGKQDPGSPTTGHEPA
jgi:hypothetical protein